MFDGPKPPRAPRRTPLKSFRSLGHLGKLPRRGEIAPHRKRGLVTAWFAACGEHCGVCGVKMVRPRPEEAGRLGNLATIDHIIARGLGGTNALSNLRVICASCNNAKSHGENRDLIERRRMYRQRALKAARTRARNKARADVKSIRKAALKAYHKARSTGATEEEACAKAAATRAVLEAAA